MIGLMDFADRVYAVCFLQKQIPNNLLVAQKCQNAITGNGCPMPANSPGFPEHSRQIILRSPIQIHFSGPAQKCCFLRYDFQPAILKAEAKHIYRSRPALLELLLDAPPLVF